MLFSSLNNVHSMLIYTRRTYFYSFYSFPFGFTYVLLFQKKKMVLVEISVPDSERGDSPAKREWAIIELQGTLEMASHCKDDPLAGKFIGDLHFSNSGEPTLIIGHHILYGKTIKLEKPFAVVRKKSSSPTKKSGTDAPSEGTRYDVMGLIKLKLIFNQRPKPIIANVPKKV